MTLRAEQSPVNAGVLKTIAVLSMLIDHIGAVLFPQYTFMRIIGRIAFPVYAFLISEGYAHTSDRRRYLGRLLIFAVISEVPFDLAFYRTPVNTGSQNVFFTLAAGLLAICIWEYGHTGPGNADMAVRFAAVLGIGLLAEFAGTDYGICGVLLIWIFHNFRKDGKISLGGYGLAAVVLAGMGAIEAHAIIALIFICFYNGRRGWQPAPVKYGFYAFYPVHLLILAFINGI